MASEDKKILIVSLGSSFAAGPGISPQIEPFSAKRSGQNYPHLLAKELDADLTDLSVSGATLLNITREPQTPAFSNDTFPPQISSVPEDADIITVTAGGNDIGYIGNMIQDAESATTLGWAASTLVQGVRSFKSIFSQPSTQINGPLSPEELPERLGDTLDKLHERAPRARIYLVEYLAVLGPCTKPHVDITFDQETIDHHSQVANALQQAYAVAVATRSDWCERVPIHECSLEHALGSQEPWVNGFSHSLIREGAVLHPNLNGMKAVAGILLKTIRKGTLKQAE
ncbi:hypothetical protein N7520_000601 [Penicillium odoratum]|uniref:uncharacterized protein n=1 Tax=Penicillium odoratum TaxID=1167516 RepID=UPI0025496DF9|nr:uncharacterized protein N7520_000601 [Penicillium odoratum]KAJ5777355.1 hypothetical protein N7520_000601 [Penicillium odoratum]